MSSPRPLPRSGRHASRAPPPGGRRGPRPGRRRTLRPADGGAFRVPELPDSWQATVDTLRPRRERGGEPPEDLAPLDEAGERRLVDRLWRLFAAPDPVPDSVAERGGSAPVTQADARAAVRVPSVDDGTVYAVLRQLVILEGQRLSYRTLAVEQIGSVYEALMGYRVVSHSTATGRRICSPRAFRAVRLSNG